MQTKINFYLRRLAKKAKENDTKKEAKKKPGRNIGANRSEKETSIQCHYSVSNKIPDETGKLKTKTIIYVLNTGLKIKFSEWDAKKAQPKDSRPDKIKIINELTEFGQRVDAKVKEIVASTGHLPTSTGLSAALAEGNKTPIIQNGKPEVKPVSKDYFFEVYDEYIAQMRTQHRKASIKKYLTVLGSLNEYKGVIKTPITFEGLTLRFFEKYRLWLLEKQGRNKTETGLLNDTVSKYIATIKTFARWAYDRNYHKSDEFNRVKAPRKVKHDIVTLTESELLQFYYFDFSNNKRLERVRDLFCFGAFTGQRWGDVEAFNKKDIKNNVWDFIAGKTGKRTMIPFVGFSKTAKTILEKYNYELPIISDVKFNKYLKEAGQKAGIDKEVTIKRESGSRKIEVVQPKYAFMSSHMARRSFVTILLEKGCTVFEVMKFTGHTDVKTLMKYENVSQETAIRALERIGEITNPFTIYKAS